MRSWWRRGACMVVLFVVAGAPAVAAACAELCLPTTRHAEGHHGSDGAHHETGSAVADCHGSAAQAPVSLVPVEPCDDHEIAGIVAPSLTAGREDTLILIAAQGLAQPAGLQSGSERLVSVGGPGVGTAPPRPTAASLALRI